MRHHLIGVALAAAALATIVFAGCSSGPATPPNTPTSNPATAQSSGVAVEHNQADVTFAQQMIPHHAQAVAMTDLAATRAVTPQVRDLAGRIARGQGPEIEQMNTMLDTWGAPRPQTGSMSSMAMTGMMSDQQMDELAAAGGPAFDQTFLTMMTAHHQGAVTMAQAELGSGQNPQAKQLAQAIITAQQAELVEMATLLRQG